MKRFNKTKSIYALLIAVAAMIGVTIYGSCSADEDYGDYSSRDELFTLADGIMGRGGENIIIEWYGIDAGEATDYKSAIYGNQSFVIKATITWDTNQEDANNTHVSCSIDIKDNEMITLPNVDNPLPLYRVCKLNPDLNSYIVKTFTRYSSKITVGETVICYQIDYNDQGIEIGSNQVGEAVPLEFEVDVTHKVTLHQSSSH